MEDVTFECSCDFQRGSAWNDFLASCQLQTLEVTTREKVWVFPKVPFVEFEEADEQWARPLGFGSEEEVTRTLKTQGYISRVDESGLEFQTVPTPESFYRDQ